MILQERDELVRAKSIPPSSAEVEESDPAWPEKLQHDLPQHRCCHPGIHLSTSESFWIVGCRRYGWD